MIEEIKYRKEVIAVVVRRGYKKDGISFFTPNEFSQQLAYMQRPAGYRIEAHIHRPVPRSVDYTRETIFVRKGTVKVDLYSQEKKFVKSIVLKTGDVILLAHGGHGFTMIKPTEMIEVKQGPYVGFEDKEKFETNI